MSSQMVTGVATAGCSSAEGRKSSLLFRSQRKGLVRVLILALCLGAWWFTLAPRSIGGPSTYVLVSGTSMLPLYHTGDLVIAHSRTSYHVGETVVFSVDGGHVIHRLWSGNAVAGWRTKGVNKPAPDLWRIPNKDVMGTAWLTVPGVGQWLRWIGTTTGRVAVAGVLAMLVAAWPRRRKAAEGSRSRLVDPASAPGPSAGLSAALLSASFGVVMAVSAWMEARTAGLHGLVTALAWSGLRVQPFDLGIAAIVLLAPSVPFVALLGQKELRAEYGGRGQHAKGGTASADIVCEGRQELAGLASRSQTGGRSVLHAHYRGRRPAHGALLAPRGGRSG